MFSIFTRRTPDDEMKSAQALFEKVTSIKSDSRDARTLRIRMGLLYRAHLDKSFVNGAEQTAAWQQLMALALAKGKEKPPLPEPSVFQKIKSGDNEIFVYLPEEYAHEAHELGAKYQRADITADKAIESMQALANQICLYDLKLDEPFQVLQFLRDELSGTADNQNSAGEL